MVSLTAWTISALLMVPVFMYATTMGRDTNSCNIIWPESTNVTGQTAFILYSFVLSFAVPLLLIFVFYCLVIRKLQTVGPKNKSKASTDSRHSEKFQTKHYIAIIVSIFINFGSDQ